MRGGRLYRQAGRHSEADFVRLTCCVKSLVRGREDKNCLTIQLNGRVRTCVRYCLTQQIYVYQLMIKNDLTPVQYVRVGPVTANYIAQAQRASPVTRGFYTGKFTAKFQDLKRKCSFHLYIYITQILNALLYFCHVFYSEDELNLLVSSRYSHQ